jgi:hypothetical protein
VVVVVGAVVVVVVGAAVVVVVDSVVGVIAPLPPPLGGGSHAVAPKRSGMASAVAPQRLEPRLRIVVKALRSTRTSISDWSP